MMNLNKETDFNIPLPATVEKKGDQVDKDVALLKNTHSIIQWLGDVSVANAIDKEKGKLTAEKIKHMRQKLGEFVERYSKDCGLYKEAVNKLKECQDKLNNLSAAEHVEIVETLKEKVAKLETEMAGKVEVVVKEHTQILEAYQKETEVKHKKEITSKRKAMEEECFKKLKVLDDENKRKIKTLEKESDKKIKAMKEEYKKQLQTMEEESEKRVKSVEMMTEETLKKKLQSKKKLEEEAAKSVSATENSDEILNELKKENEALKNKVVYFEAQSHLKDGIVEYFKREADVERAKRIQAELSMELKTMDLSEPAKILKPNDDSTILQFTGPMEVGDTNTAPMCSENVVSQAKETLQRKINNRRVSSPSRKKGKEGTSRRKQSLNGKAKKRSADNILLQEAVHYANYGVNGVSANEDDEEVMSPRRRPKRNTRPPSRLSEKVQIATAVEREGGGENNTEKSEERSPTHCGKNATIAAENGRKRVDYTRYEFREVKEEQHSSSSDSDIYSSSDDSVDSDSNLEQEVMDILENVPKNKKSNKRKRLTQTKTKVLDIACEAVKQVSMSCLCGKLCQKIGESGNLEEGSSLSNVKCEVCGKSCIFPSLPEHLNGNIKKQDISPITHSESLSTSFEVPTATADTILIASHAKVNGKSRSQPNQQGFRKNRKRKIPLTVDVSCESVIVDKKMKTAELKKKNKGRKIKIRSSTDSMSFSSTDVEDRRPHLKKKGRPKKAPLQESTENETPICSDESIIVNMGLEYHHRIVHSTLDNDKGFACKCGKVYSNDERLKYHMISGLFGDLFKCNHEGCGIVFHHFKVYKSHVQAQHGIGMKSKYGCLLCGVEFESFKGLRDHYKECPNKPTLDKALSLQEDAPVVKT